ncbi:MAG: amidohydrolase, partial [Chloroflexota bacterium]
MSTVQLLLAPRPQRLERTSDGYTLPEINYTSAKLGKQAIKTVLEELVEEGMLTQQDAQEAAGMILADNARRLYRL